jgi:hypothetical protein
MLDPSQPIASEPVYIEWRDHAKEDGLSVSATNPTSFVLRGVTNLIDETATDYIVCQFVGRDEFCAFDRLAICKADVLRFIRLNNDIMPRGAT